MMRTFHKKQDQLSMMRTFHVYVKIRPSVHDESISCKNKINCPWWEWFMRKQDQLSMMRPLYVKSNKKLIKYLIINFLLDKCTAKLAIHHHGVIGASFLEDEFNFSVTNHCRHLHSNQISREFYETSDNAEYIELFSKFTQQFPA